ncbi:coiled-coil domain-containing protein 80 [Drosophila subpulchrella]|uniref:coiled-coil domain-containing protein 80 n=1 Tax=Drosophila subpulchrella TaxID=1486046 RepID=UPI0018A13200|nr:coiled-coil domain-containing protein 80 [Drosophila subpulchrella]
MSRSSILILLLLGVSCLEILQARSLPEGERHRFVRRRISPDDPDLEIIEVKEVYYVRRPKKVVVPLDEDEMDWRIRCDFEPKLPECRHLIKKPVVAPTTKTTTTTTQAPTSTTTTTRRTTTTPEPLRDESMERRIRCEFDPTAEECAPSTTSTTTTTTTTTTTELPILPEFNDPESEPESNILPELNDPETETEPEQEAEPQSDTDPENDSEGAKEEVTEEPTPEDVIPLADDDGESDDNDTEDLDDQEDDLEDIYDVNPNEGGTHSIGAHEIGDWN